MNKTAKQQGINRIRAQILRNPRDPALWQELNSAEKAQGQEDSTEARKSTEVRKVQDFAVMDYANTINNNQEQVQNLIEICLNDHRANDFARLQVSTMQLKTMAPDNPWTLALLGVLHTSKKSYDTSKSYLENALLIEPSNNWFRLWICENAIHSRDIEAFIRHALMISTAESNQRMIFVSLMAAALKTVLSSNVIAPENLVNLYKEILFDLAKEDANAAKHAYYLVIRSIEARLYNIATSTSSTKEAILDLHEIKSRATKLLKGQAMDSDA